MSKLTGRLTPDQCEFCGKKTNAFGDDSCIGRLDPEIVASACCGHGFDILANVEFQNGYTVSGEAAINVINEIKGAS